jgi:hypothetical protein
LEIVLAQQNVQFDQGELFLSSSKEELVKNQQTTP